MILRDINHQYQMNRSNINKIKHRLANSKTIPKHWYCVWNISSWHGKSPFLEAFAASYQRLAELAYDEEVLSSAPANSKLFSTLRSILLLDFQTPHFRTNNFSINGA